MMNTRRLADTHALDFRQLRTNTTSIAVALQDCLTETAEILQILPFECVAGCTETVRENFRISAAAVHHSLYVFLHSSSTP